eukprot:4678214-Pyramimonas_sp.AAC.1
MAYLYGWEIKRGFFHDLQPPDDENKAWECQSCSGRLERSGVEAHQAADVDTPQAADVESAPVSCAPDFVVTDYPTVIFKSTQSYDLKMNSAPGDVFMVAGDIE